MAQCFWYMSSLHPNEIVIMFVNRKQYKMDIAALSLKPILRASQIIVAPLKFGGV